MSSSDWIRQGRLTETSGIVTLVAGLLFFIDFVIIGSVLRSYPNLREYPMIPLSRTFLEILISIGLSFAPIGFLRLRVWGNGWKKKVGIIGMSIVVLGSASYITGVVYVYMNPTLGTRQFFTPLGSVLLTLGMLIAFTAILAAGVWRGWRRFVPMLVWLYFPLQFPFQALLFLGQNRGPNPFLLGTWGLCWAVLGWTIWRSPRSLPG